MQKEKWKQIKTYGQKGTETEKQIVKKTGRQTERRTEIGTDRNEDGWIDGQTQRQGVNLLIKIRLKR